MSQAVRLNGKLYVSTRSGRFGNFNIAKLVVPIGEFVVKDKWTEQLEPGAYDGAFEIGKVFVKTIQLKSGAILTELRARIDEYALLDSGDVPEDVTIGANEEDPIVEESEGPNAAEPPIEILTRLEDGEEAPETEDDGDAVLARLFGADLLPLTDVVELDPAMDRERFRKQRDHLKDAGYKYQPDRKVWALSKEE